MNNKQVGFNNLKSLTEKEIIEIIEELGKGCKECFTKEELIKIIKEVIADGGGGCEECFTKEDIISLIKDYGSGTGCEECFTKDDIVALIKDMLNVTVTDAFGVAQFKAGAL